MKSLDFHSPLRTLATGLAAAALAGAAFVGGARAQTPSAATPPVSAWSGEQLEREFWRCDHAATTSMLGFAAAARCSSATEELRRRRFGGDFAAMMAWWREHKAVQHAALEVPQQAPQRQALPVPEPIASPLERATPQQLQAAYLACDRLATTEQFDGRAAEGCSLVYEALKARVFAGSSERLIAWWRQQQAASAASAS